MLRDQTAGKGKTLRLSALAVLLTIGIAGGLAAGEAEPEPPAKAHSQQPSDTAAGGSYSGPGSLSADGRYFVFLSEARDLVPGQVDVKGTLDVFLHDRVAGTTVLVSHRRGALATAANAPTTGGHISANGGAIVLTSRASDLDQDQLDSDDLEDAFVYDSGSAEIELISRD